jgi:hypothetical protein
MTKNIIVFFLILFSLSVAAQQRDTLRLTITKIDTRTKTDTVYYFSSRVDTIALQTVKSDTSKMVKDINPQDLEESKYKIRFMGSARINGFYDFSGMKSTEGFLPYDIPVGAENVPGLSSIYIGARQSRLGIEGTANTKVGKVKTYMEVDFASTTESFWRLRHAYAEWNFFKLGYTWSTFMDNASLPITVEFEGPNSSLSKRQGLIRYERKLKTQNILGISIESPKADYFNPADSMISNASDQRNVDLACRYKYFNRWGHVQVAGIIRRIDFYDEGKMKAQPGWGVLLSTTIHPAEKHQINSQFSMGKGISYYYVGFSGRKLDAVYDQESNSMLLKGIYGGFINYSYKYKPTLVFSVIAGISKIRNEEFEPGDAFKSSQYYGATVFYNPIETISLGLEGTFGTRKNFDNQSATATRISMLAKFDF